MTATLSRKAELHREPRHSYRSSHRLPLNGYPPNTPSPFIMLTAATKYACGC
ncbi:UNVERIFIED_ORG: hypothetical protein J2Y77_002397 [Pseudomonas lini]